MCCTNLPLIVGLSVGLTIFVVIVVVVGVICYRRREIDGNSLRIDHKKANVPRKDWSKIEG